MYLCVNDKKHYHSSAVYAAALHSISLPFRMDSLGPTSTSAFTSGGLDINSIVHMLSGQPRQNMVAILDATMPAPSIGNFYTILVYFVVNLSTHATYFVFL